MRERTAVQGSDTLVMEEEKAVFDAAQIVEQLFITPSTGVKVEVARITLAPAARPTVSMAAEPGTEH